MLMTPAAIVSAAGPPRAVLAPLAIASNPAMVPCVARRVMSRDNTLSIAATALSGSPSRTADRQSWTSILWLAAWASLPNWNTAFAPEVRMPA